ncbi:MAG: tRNA (N6-isopentenyl adenosine(37)-C2)-methylthiotransferase MiaB [Planctomycetota bacterium]|nr:tRNA (N6-isopentenyl adenosine(37)-C2)-methylthiotransferase MiaB [Planctomycetota bacterium]
MKHEPLATPAAAPAPERGIEGPGQDPDHCGLEGTVYAPDAAALAGSRAHPLIAGTKVHLLTYGCQMNVYDSEMVAGLLGERGAGFVAEPEAADLLIVNTCSVRAHAEDRVYSRLGRIKFEKRRRPGFLVAVMGCMAQKEGERIAERFPYVDLIVGTRQLHRFPQLLERIREGAPTPLLAIDETPDVNFGETVARRETPFQAYLAVTRGCNKRCTFCVVPYTRGPEVSRPVEDVVAEARRLAADGVVELTLLGQTIDTYGYDLGANLWTLLRALHGVEGLKRIRFITSHPEECRDDLWRAMADLGGKVMPFIHMPAQSGSNAVLRRMARGYTRERYLDVVASARSLCPGIEIASDWIVGFSGESDADFERSLTLMETFRPQMSYIFKYSVREGTPAQRLPDDVPDEVKKERHRRMLELQERISLELNRERVGQVEEVLVEGPSKTDPARFTGRGRARRLVHFSGDAALAGKLVRVEVTGATGLSLLGERIE